MTFNFRMSTGIGTSSPSTARPRLIHVTEIVASVLGVAGVGFKLSLILNAISLEIANAPYEIKAISKSVILHSQLLKQTAAILDEANIHSQEAVKTTNEVLEETQAVFTDIDTMLNRVRSTRPDGSVSPSIPQRFRWCFRKHSIEYLLGRMDRLQMSLSLMLQIIHLGITMASTSPHDSEARVQTMTNKLQRERVEAQTIVIQYYQESQSLHRLYVAAREEQTEPTSPIEYRKGGNDSDALTLVNSQDSQLTKVDGSVDLDEKTLVVVTPYKDVIHDKGDDWTKLGNGKQEMLTHSSGIVTNLLERWTRWRERRGEIIRKPRSKHGARYKSSVQDWEDEDDEHAHHFRHADREDSPAGKYLEGTTTNWREPHSANARIAAVKLRKAYEPYQASVEGSSDIDASPSSNNSSKRPSKRYAINSDSGSSESEDEVKTGEQTRPRRRSSAVTIPQKPKAVELPASQSYNPPSSANQSRGAASLEQKRPTLSPAWSQYGQGHPPRPGPVPEQNSHSHAYSSPAPNAYMHVNKQATYPPPSIPNSQSQTGQYAPPNPYVYPYPQPSLHGRPPPLAMPRLSPQNSRQGQTARPPSRDAPPRTMSRDGRPPKSPSRLSREYSTADYRAYEDEKKRHRKETRRRLSDGAAKGLLAGGGFAVLLEALDSLDL